jgi:hypothetical protein
MKEPLIAIVTSKGWIKLPSLVVMCILFVYTGCATAKPCICPPAEVIIQKVPVPIPCPPPPEIPAPTLQIVSLSANLTPWPDLLQAVMRDYVELQRVEAELRQVLATYATTPGTPP